VVDWRRLTPQLGHGDLVCAVHGRVDAARGPWELPICPRCEQRPQDRAGDRLVRRVASLMIEIRRDGYMTEPGGPPHEGLDSIASALSALVSSASAPAA
jgi:hypothetical protein